jgi:hypothetical protein
VRLSLRQARLLAAIDRRMRPVVSLIVYFDRVGERGDPTQANALLGAPAVSLGDWMTHETEWSANPCG